MSQPIKRRRLLQLAGGTLATVGANQLNLFQSAQHYDRALAQPARRKLALLVGINDYPESIPSLKGCLTDVEMQYELLVHRYGFDPQDIRVVSDSTLTLPDQTITSPPTRQNILNAFETHLIGQAQSDDVVVFHYSGHGSYVQDEAGVTEFNGFNGTLVPSDGRGQGRDRVDDIMGKTLFLLSLALPTDAVTLVLDSCHAGGGIRGNTLVRALENANAQPSDQELDYQRQWMNQLELDEETLRIKRQQGIAKGVALGSTQLGYKSAEVPFEDFHAGAFTYLLTRYLWQLPVQQPLSDTFANIARSTKDVANTARITQDPVYDTARGQNWELQPVYLLDPGRPPAEAVLRNIRGNQVSFWLGGQPVNNLAAKQAIFNLVDDRGNSIGEVHQTERIGLLGRGTLQATTRLGLRSGQLMREQIRGVPTNLILRVGIAESLVDDSTTALAQLNAIDRIEAASVTPAAPFDYLLGRFTPEVRAQAQQRYAEFTAEPNSIGLLTSDLIPVPATFDSASESVEAAINRLRPRLKILLAGKMLGTVVNGQTSNLKADVSLFAVDQPTALFSTGSRAAQTASAIAHSVQIPTNTEIRVQVQNDESQDLFVSAIYIANTGHMGILYPVLWDAPEDATRIAQGEIIQIPDPTAPESFHFVIEGPSNFLELLILVSTEPLRDALRSLQAIARGRGARSGDPLAFVEGARSPDESEDAPVEVLDALLGDVSRSSRQSTDTPISADIQQVSSNHLAAFSVMVEVLA
ncbi:MAG: caspase family protein [Leptolyngbyaceae cyanobacterium]